VQVEMLRLPREALRFPPGPPVGAAIRPVFAPAGQQIGDVAPVELRELVQDGE
jgi:hypothetical protein